MKSKKYHGMLYHLWNPFTSMNEFLPLIGIGPIVITRGEGPYIFNERGKRFINGMSSLWNVAIGHGREELVEAATAQMRELAYASCFRQVHPRAIELAAKLVEITADQYSHVFLSSNGSDAVEAALMMSRQYHRQSPDSKDHSRYKIISLRGSYHGVSYGAMSTAGLASNEIKMGPLVPGFVQIAPPYCYRCFFEKNGYPECGLACANALEKAILSEGAETVAAFIMEPIMGVLGSIDPPEEYYSRVGEICRRHGLLFIADEVTTGFGRTGKLFVSEDWTPRPDILCLSKAITSGYLPLAATLATDEIYERFNGEGRRFDYGPTASGHPVCAAVALRNIDIIIGENLPENATRVGEYLKSRLEDLMKNHKIIGQVRGRGLMLGIELVKDRQNRMPIHKKDTFNITVDTAILGLLVYPADNVLGLFPPLIIDNDIAEKIVEILDQSLETGITAEIEQKARLVEEFAAAKLAHPDVK